MIIPTLNAAACLPHTLAALGPVAQVIVVDGGSRDHTVGVAAAAGATVLTSPRGRGPQIATGVAAAAGDWLLILHADTRLQPGWRGDAAAHIAGDAELAACFRFALDSGAPQARRLERLVAWRCHVLRLPYGDQGLLIHRDLLTRVGGVRPLPLMEDVDLVRRLGRRRIALLPTAALTSASRWHRHGWLRRSARNLACLSLWFIGVPPRLIARLYG